MIPSYEFRMLLEAQRKHLLAAHHEAHAFREERPMDAIELALGRIREGNFGICTRCAGEIERARLKADPTAEHCTACDGET